MLLPRRVLRRQHNGRESIARMEQETTRKTNILDLNDHCIREVFQHLELTDLVAVSDVCGRFRYNAQAHFATSEHSTELWFWLYNAKPNEKFLEISKTIRIFGAVAKSITIFDFRGKCDSILHPTTIQIINLMRKHCTEQLSELGFFVSRISARVIRMLRPLFPHLKVLNIGGSDGIGILFESFPKLESICLDGISLNGNDFTNFLRRNSHLKKISICSCHEVNYNIFRSIATYVPHIEDLHFSASSHSGGTFEENYKHLTKLLKLTSLSLGDTDDSSLSVIIGMSKANIPIENLQFHIRETSRMREQYMEGILGFKKLKRLTLLGNECLSSSDIVSISKNLTELQVITLIKPELPVQDLLEILRNGDKLKQIYCYWVGDDDDDEDVKFMHVEYFVEMIRILEKRPERTHLKLMLVARDGFSTNIPKELMDAHKDILTLEMID